MAYSSENVRRVKELLARRRSQANDAAAQNRDHLHQISPEAVEIDQALGRTSMRLFAIACQPNGEDKDKQLAALRAENLSLQEARAALLQHLGLPKNYTEPQYVCHLCGDTGYTEQGMCACMKQALTYEGFRSSGIGYLIESQSFDNFSLGYYQGEDQDKMRQNLAIAKNYAQTFTLASGNLLLMGNTGLGKTHLDRAPCD